MLAAISPKFEISKKKFEISKKKFEISKKRGGATPIGGDWH